MSSPHIVQIVPLAERRFLPSAAVMALFGYKNRSSFHHWVKSSSVPHIQLNERRFVFDEQQLNDWLASRSNRGGGV